MADEAKILRHSIRGIINALKLGATAMDARLTKEEAVEFLTYMIDGAEQMCTELDRYDLLPDSVKVLPPPPASVH